VVLDTRQKARGPRLLGQVAAARSCTAVLRINTGLLLGSRSSRRIAAGRRHPAAFIVAAATAVEAIMVVTKADEVRAQMQRVRDADQRMNLNAYSTDPWSRQRLANQRSSGSASSSTPRWPPRSVFTHPDVDGWIVEADGREFRASNVLDAENAMRAAYGQPPLRAERRDPRDDPPPREEGQ
jgi:hypothetical protein